MHVNNGKCYYLHVLGRMRGLLVYTIYSVRTSSYFHFLCTVKDINAMLDLKHGLKCGLKHGLKGVPVNNTTLVFSREAIKIQQVHCI